MDRNQQTSHDLELINLTQDAWRRVHEDCRDAKHSIDFEQYILRDDENGTSFLRLLMAKAKEGIRVRLLLDRVGCRNLYQSKIIDEVKSSGAKVYFYNPVSWLNLPFPKTWFPRSHIKMSVVDSQVLHLGGVCFADYMSQWRDLHMRISGPIAQTIPFGWEQFRWNEKPAPASDLRYVVSTSRNNPVYKELIRAINSARNEIILATPYFLPPRKLKRALYRAVARGIDVKVVMSEFSDVPWITRVAHSYVPRMLNKGLQLYLFKKEIYHAKYMIIDDTWATVGSTNIDHISFFRNREANLLMQCRSTIERLREHASQDLEDSVPLTADYWHNLPWYTRFVGFAGRYFKRLL